MLLKKNLTCISLTAGIIYIFFCISACNRQGGRPDINDEGPVIESERFEKDLFGIDASDPANGLESLKNKYGNFFNLFLYQITSIGSPDSALMIDRLYGFVNDTNFRTIYRDCEALYNDFSVKDAELTKAFRYYSNYFPGKAIPRVVTMISGFSYPIVCDSATLGISLDMYLGPGYRYYSTLEPPLPNYLRNRMHGDFMICDAMKGWATSDYGIDESSARMIDFMISQGRLLYFLDKITPDEPDTIKSGYSGSQLQWCIQNEKKIWSFFIDNQLLFSFDPNLMNKFVNDGPTTNGFPNESPGNIGQFIGWQIVKSYMKNNPTVSLQQLMEQKDLVKIFNESKYKPQK